MRPTQVVGAVLVVLGAIAVASIVISLKTREAVDDVSYQMRSLEEKFRTASARVVQKEAMGSMNSHLLALEEELEQLRTATEDDNQVSRDGSESDGSPTSPDAPESAAKPSLTHSFPYLSVDKIPEYMVRKYKLVKEDVFVALDGNEYGWLRIRDQENRPIAVAVDQAEVAYELIDLFLQKLDIVTQGDGEITVLPESEAPRLKKTDARIHDLRSELGRVRASFGLLVDVRASQ